MQGKGERNCIFLYIMPHGVETYVLNLNTSLFNQVADYMYDYFIIVLTFSQQQCACNKPDY